jgi:hypothetical protein
LFLSSAFFFVSAIPVLWSIQIKGTSIRYLIWIVPLALVWVASVHRRRLVKNQQKS